MPLYTRNQFPAFLKQSTQESPRVVLFFGERYLCRDGAEKLEKILLQPGGSVHPIDGEQEDINTLVYKLKSMSLLPGRQVYKVTDSRLFYSKTVAQNIWKKVVQAHEAKKAGQVQRSLKAFLQAGGLQPGAEESELAQLSGKQWQHYFNFSKPDGDLSWLDEPLHALKNHQSTGGKAPQSADLFMTCLNEQLPESNFLILIAEEVDKRKKLFKYFKDNHYVIDLSVESGASAKAQKSQKEVLQSLIRETLGETGKSCDSAVIEKLIERVGFHPVAVVTELRKVMLYVGDRNKITLQDLDAVVGRTRQEAIFELTSALTARDIRKVLVIAERLQDNGIHPLAIIGALRNTTRQLLLFRALQDKPQLGYSPSMPANVFQSKCIPLLKELEEWKKECSGHPYAIFIQFKTASHYSPGQLQNWMRLLLQAEMRLKGSPVAPQTVLHHLFTSMLSAAKNS